MSGVDFGELVKRAIKYIIEGLVVAVAAYVIPKRGNKFEVEELVIIGLVAAATFAVLDVFVPAMGSSARNGAGLGIGLNLVRFPGGF
jgi:ABC-type Co2+ transport system permease subunit